MSERKKEREEERERGKGRSREREMEERSEGERRKIEITCLHTQMHVLRVYIYFDSVQKYAQCVHTSAQNTQTQLLLHSYSCRVNILWQWGVVTPAMA